MLAAGAMVAVAALLFAMPAVRLDRTRTFDVPRPGLPDPEDEPKSMIH
jgi:hypothetical protein